MSKMLWAEWRKLRRSSIILLTIFATVLIAVIVLVAGRETTIDGFYLSDALVHDDGAAVGDYVRSSSYHCYAR